MSQGSKKGPIDEGTDSSETEDQIYEKSHYTPLKERHLLRIPDNALIYVDVCRYDGRSDLIQGLVEILESSYLKFKHRYLLSHKIFDPSNISYFDAIKGIKLMTEIGTDHVTDIKYVSTTQTCNIRSAGVESRDLLDERAILIIDDYVELEKLIRCQDFMELLAARDDLKLTVVYGMTVNDGTGYQFPQRFKNEIDLLIMGRSDSQEKGGKYVRSFF
jgi:hypothetical protein